MSLREWAGCEAVLSLLPGRSSSLLTRPAPVSAVDACSDFLALASDSGLVFWYDRANHTLQRLRCSNTQCTVTTVKIVSTVDYMVAAGNDAGQVDIFQIPKPHPDAVPDHLKPKTAQVERYTVGDLHKSDITALEWSKNGMKLFSGDKDGVVVLTEIDFYMHICKSSEIINETYEIVQLSYYQNFLMVSSVNRAIICQKESSKWNVNQIGKKDRKNLCKLGGVFLFSYDKPNDVSIYSARPGLRIWTSDRQGNVLKTLLFKEATASPSINVELLNPGKKSSSLSAKDLNFGPLYIFQNKYLVSYNEDFLYILDPDKLIAVATVNKFKGIQSIAVNKDEIFVLQKDQVLARIAYNPDVHLQKTCEKLMSKSLFNPIEKAFNTIKKNLSNTEPIKLLPDFSESKTYIKNILNEPAISALPDNVDIAHGEECFELPPVKKLDEEIDQLQIQNPLPFIELEPSQNSDSICEPISQIEFHSDILHSTKRYKKNNIVVINESADKTNDNLEIKINKNNLNKSPKKIKPDIMNISYCGPSGLLPDDTSPESIEKKVQDMEEKLAKVLELETITIKRRETFCEKPSENKNNFDIPIKNTSQSKTANEECVKTPERTMKNLSDDAKCSKLTNKKANVLPPPIELTPECVSIPGVWNLKQITINDDVAKSDARNKKKNSSLKHVSGRVFDADWELI